ncbi:MAG TPA: DUF2804 family protein [Solirubrobacteraceae bacterium]|nr:DUF2804 family protein [Solirubrobacteraceae bacterium]
MPLHIAGRPLKRWRYVGFFSQEAIVCVAKVRVGPLRDAFWAVWERRTGRLWRGRSGVALSTGRAAVRSRRVRIELSFAEVAGIETVCPSGTAYGWTRKQGGVAGTVLLQLSGHLRDLHGHVLIDDTAAYYERHTHWLWSAGAGRTVDGRAVAWNLVSGVNDPAACSERTIWLDGEATEAPPCAFAADLSAVDDLRFEAEAVLSRQTNLGLVRSSYRQPLGRFSGRLPGGIELAEGFGVMEDHDAWW